MSLKRLAALFQRKANGYLENGEKIALFLGAGADIASGGLSFRQLKRLALKQYAETEPSVAASEELIDYRFQKLFESIETPAERAGLIDIVFRLNQTLVPSDAYRMLVLLAQRRAVDAIITTNFDTMLEVAQAEMGVTAIQTFAAGLARPFPMDEKFFHDPERVPYIKMHGCISSHSVTHITAEELENPQYDASLLRLLNDKLANAHVVFLGYSGNDAGLARALKSSLSTDRPSLFFCNPTPPDPNAPLVAAVGGMDKFIVAKTDFNGAIDSIARPILQRPYAASVEPVFIESLFRWRVDYFSEEFQKAHTGFSDRGTAPNVVRRQAVERQVESFLLSDKPLAVVVGNSGYGKSTLGVRLRQLFRTTDTDVLLLSANTFVSTDFEEEIVRRIDGYQIAPGARLQAIEIALRRRSKRLIIFLDGLNEFDSDLQRCVQLFKSVLRFCAYSPENPSIRVATTIRSDSWAAFQRLLDQTDLERAMWTPNRAPGSVAAIGLDKLSEAEFDEALTRINRLQGTNYSSQRIPPAIRELLRDPFFLSIAATERLDNWAISTSAASFEALIHKRIERARLLRSTDEIVAALAIVALELFKRGREVVDHGLMTQHLHDSALLRSLKDVGLLVDAENGTVHFAHDRIFEFFLARGFGTASGPSVGSVQELLAAIQDFEFHPKAMAALHLHLLMRTDLGLGLVNDALKLCTGTAAGGWTSAEKSKLLDFCQHFLVNLSADQPTRFANRFEELTDECELGVCEVSQILPYLRAAAFLPPETAIAVLPRVEDITAPSSPIAVEARIHVADRIAGMFLDCADTSIDLLADPLFGRYFGDPNVELFRRLGRILGLASLLGPDNLHQDEYESVKRSVSDALRKTVADGISGDQVIKAVIFFRAGTDRYLFNASEHGIDGFFRNPRRTAFLPIVERLASGGSLVESDFDVLAPYIDSFDFDLEFQLGNLLFIVSSLNNFETTLAVWKKLFAGLDGRSHPNFFDFLQAVIPYLYVIGNVPYDEFLAEPTERVLSQFPSVVRFHPGTLRGHARGYLDPYDQIFEDGFNPIACYGFLAPSRSRRSMRWAEYLRQDWANKPSGVPVYDKHLRKFLADRDDVAAIRIIHALGQLCILWPHEGLPALRPLLGTNNAQLRRALLRVLAETYSRYPVETLTFLDTSGSLISDREMQAIQVADGNVGRRQFEGLQWARLLHYLFQLPGAKAQVVDALRTLYSAQGLEEAALAIANRIFRPTQGEK